MTTYYAHSLPNRPVDEWRTLDAHLRGVAERAAGFGASFGAPDWAWLAGLWHDVGKFQQEFQRHVSGDPRRADHSIVGALFAREAGFPEALPLAFAIAGHHGGLANLAGSGRTGSVAGSGDLPPLSVRDYTYQPPQYLLTGAGGPWGELAWTYDRIGNRLSETRDDGSPDTYAYLANATGNTPILDQVTLSVGGTRDYAWGAAGHLEEVAAGGTSSVDPLYDSAGLVHAGGSRTRRLQPAPQERPLGAWVPGDSTNFFDPVRFPLLAPWEKECTHVHEASHARTCRKFGILISVSAQNTDEALADRCRRLEV